MNRRCGTQELEPLELHGGERQGGNDGAVHGQRIKARHRVLLGSPARFHAVLHAAPGTCDLLLAPGARRCPGPERTQLSPSHDTALRTLAAQVQLANDTVFGLGSYVFSRSQSHANRVGTLIKAGMLVINDYASNSMCQSLPFGGIKESGFDRCVQRGAAWRLHALCPACYVLTMYGGDEVAHSAQQRHSQVWRH